MSKLIIYGDMISQPVRAIILFCKLNKIPYEFEYINLSKGEQFSEKFKKINPDSYVPAIKHIDSTNKEFTLCESHAILRYLCSYFKTDEKWYPRENLFRKALIDQYLDYHHMNTRFVFTNKFAKSFFGPIIEKVGKKGKRGYDVEMRVPILLKYFDDLLGKQNYIADNVISIADLSFTCEINQFKLIEYDLSVYKNLAAYLKNMNEMPEMIEVNQVADKLSNKIFKNENPQPKF